MKIFLTGGAGFLGSALVPVLAKSSKNSIFVFDSFTHGFKGAPAPKKNILSISGKIQVYYDIYHSLRRFLPDTVVHLAAHNTRPESVGDFRKCIEVNCLGMANLVEACSNIIPRPKRIIFASSEAAENPVSHFGISKQAAEQLLLSLTRPLGIEVTVLRFPEIYGYSRSMSSTSLVNFLVDSMLQNLNIVLYSVNRKKDFLHISDAVNAINLAVKLHISESSTIPINSGRLIEIKEVVEQVRELTKYQAKLNYDESPLFTIQDSVSQSEIAKSFLSFEAKMDFETGLADLVKQRGRELKK